MKKRTVTMLALAGALTALQVQAADQIDWGMVPGGHGNNDVSRDFVSPPDPLNVTLSNEFTAWSPQQWSINQARTSTGRDQRHAVVGTRQENVAVTENVSYSEKVTTTQSAPSEQGYYSENKAGQTDQSTDGMKTGQSDRSSGTDQTEMSTDKKSERPEIRKDAQAKLTPHALIIESSLSSAMDQVKGMKGELNVTKDTKTADYNAIQAYKTFLREMRKDINVAREHERKLVTDARRYPDIANSSDLREVPSAMKALQSTIASFESKANSPQYWKNTDQAKADLDRLEQQLSNALEKVKSFSSGKLNASIA